MRKPVASGIKATEARPTNSASVPCPHFTYTVLAAALIAIAATTAAFIVPKAAPWATAASVFSSSPSLPFLHLIQGSPLEFAMPRDRAPKLQQQPVTPATFTDGGPLPACLAFDLDFTLWPFWIDTHVDPPLREPKAAADRGQYALDAHGEELRFYRDVPRVLAGARAAGIKVAAASRTHAPELAQRLLRLLRIPAIETGEAEAAVAGDGAAAAEVATTAGSDLAVTYFDNMQIYPGNKLRHLQRISESLKVDYEEILFFDDEARNRNVEQLGVVFVDVPRGLDAALVDGAIEAWRQQRRRQQPQPKQ